MLQECRPTITQELHRRGAKGDRKGDNNAQRGERRTGFNGTTIGGGKRTPSHQGNGADGIQLLVAVREGFVLDECPGSCCFVSTCNRKH